MTTVSLGIMTYVRANHILPFPATVISNVLRMSQSAYLTPSSIVVTCSKLVEPFELFFLSSTTQSTIVNTNL